MTEGLVTIITPCFNGEKFINKLMDSILKQTYKNIEFILVNDGSTDGTEQIINEYKEKFQEENITLKYIKQRNRGQAAAMNNALKHIEGQYLIWADSDDWYEADSIENMVLFLKNNENFVAVRANAAFVKDSSENEVLEIRKSTEPENTDLFKNYILEKDTYCFSGVIMIKTEKFLLSNKGREIYINKAGQNWQLILPAVYKGKTGYIDKIVYNVLIRENSHSRRKESKLDVLKRMQNHRKILNKTVRKIVDNKVEKKEYLKIIKDKYDTREKDYIIYTLRHWND